MTRAPSSSPRNVRASPGTASVPVPYTWHEGPCIARFPRNTYAVSMSSVACINACSTGESLLDDILFVTCVVSPFFRISDANIEPLTTRHVSGEFGQP